MDIDVHFPSWFWFFLFWKYILYAYSYIINSDCFRTYFIYIQWSACADNRIILQYCEYSASHHITFAVYVSENTADL